MEASSPASAALCIRCLTSAKEPHEGVRLATSVSDDELHTTQPGIEAVVEELCFLRAGGRLCTKRRGRCHAMVVEEG